MKGFVQTNASLLFWGSLFVSMVAFFTPATGQAGLPYLDKAVHFVLFFILSLSALIYFGPAYRQLTLQGIFLYMLAVEIIQQFFIPGRGAEFFDVMAGVLGMLAAQVLLYFYGNKFKYEK